MCRSPRAPARRKRTRYTTRLWSKRPADGLLKARMLAGATGAKVGAIEAISERGSKNIVCKNSAGKSAPYAGAEPDAGSAEAPTVAVKLTAAPTAAKPAHTKKRKTRKATRKTRKATKRKTRRVIARKAENAAARLRTQHRSVVHPQPNPLGTAGGVAGRGAPGRDLDSLSGWRGRSRQRRWCCARCATARPTASCTCTRRRAGG